jgi:hypothetical protein
MVGFRVYEDSEHVRINKINSLTVIHFLDQSSEIESAHPPQKGSRRRVIRVGDFGVIDKTVDGRP